MRGSRETPAKWAVFRQSQARLAGWPVLCIPGSVAAVMPTSLRRMLCVAVVIYAAAATSSALAAAPNPAQNMPISEPASCSAPTSAACENAIIADLNSAHAAMGLSAYALPSDFDTLSGDEQIFILSNLDRTAYGLMPASGLSPQLDSAAAAGVADDADPNPTAEIPANIGNYSWAANWAGGYPNAPYAYYDWMYNDGLGSPNIDCTSQNPTGCWGHRQDVLAFPDPGQIVMGAATGTDSSGLPSYAMTIVWTETTSSWTTLDYTWAQALAGGSGGGGSSGGGGTGGGTGGGGGSGGGGSSGGGGTGSGGNPTTPPSGGSTGSGQAGSAPPAGSTTPPASSQSEPTATVLSPSDPTAIIAQAVKRSHRIRFVLGAFGQASGYECALVRHGRAATSTPVFRACGSVRIYSNLPAGRYTFLVRAVGSDGGAGATERESFTIHA